MMAVEILKYPILILQTSVPSLLRLSFLDSGVGTGLVRGGAGGGEGGAR